MVTDIPAMPEVLASDESVRESPPLREIDPSGPLLGNNGRYRCRRCGAVRRNFHEYADIRYKRQPLGLMEALCDPCQSNAYAHAESYAATGNAEWFRRRDAKIREMVGRKPQGEGQ